jgi:hypothetical protein
MRRRRRSSAAVESLRDHQKGQRVWSRFLEDMVILFVFFHFFAYKIASESKTTILTLF